MFCRNTSHDAKSKLGAEWTVTRALFLLFFVLLWVPSSWRHLWVIVVEALINHCKHGNNSNKINVISASPGSMCITAFIKRPERFASWNLVLTMLCPSRAQHKLAEKVCAWNDLPTKCSFIMFTIFCRDGRQWLRTSYEPNGLVTRKLGDVSYEVCPLSPE